jgi:polar amino acid transport system substrate-binding protein
MRVLLVLSALLFIITACADLPRDQKDTLKHIQHSQRLRVGLIENPPWVIRSGDEPAGVEVELIKRFASEIGAEPEWSWGGEEKLLSALEKFELDLVLGGFGDKTPWKTRIGMTSPFYAETFDVGVLPDVAWLSDLKDREIVIRNDSRLAGYLREKGARPVAIEDLSEANGRPVAAPLWQLDKLQLSPTGNDFHTDRHIVATPPGENQFVKRLDEFFSAQREAIPALLQQQPEVAVR